MPEFWKNPKFWISVIVILWLVYLIDGNLEQPVELYIVPHFFHRTVRLGAVMAGSGILGAILTVVIQTSWRRRASRKASVSAAAAESSAKTVP